MPMKKNQDKELENIEIQSPERQDLKVINKGVGTS